MFSVMATRRVSGPICAFRRRLNGGDIRDILPARAGNEVDYFPRVQTYANKHAPGSIGEKLYEMCPATRRG